MNLLVVICRPAGIQAARELFVVVVGDLNLVNLLIAVYLPLSKISLLSSSVLSVQTDKVLKIQLSF